MINFTFENPTKIIFGKGTESQVGIESKCYGTKVLLHYGGGSIKRTGLYDKIVKALEAEGLTIFEFGGVQPNPRLSLVKEGIEICRKNNIQFILAVGGGSVIDSAKAIGVGVPYSGDVWDFFTRKTQPSSTIPVGVILTIPAAGSEASMNSVLTNENGWYKKGTGSVVMRPKFAILNPELTYTLPPYQTSAGIADMMAHIFERYFTNESNVELTDRLSEATLRAIINNAKIVLKEPQNYNARAEIMWAGSIAHNGLLGTGRIEDWATHAIEHEISGIYDITHGAGLAILLPAWMEYVYKQNVNKFAQFAVRVFDVEPDFNSLDKAALEGIKRLKHFFKLIALPTSLSEADIPEDKFEEMSRKATENGPIGNFVKLNSEDIVNIFRMAD